MTVCSRISKAGRGISRLDEVDLKSEIRNIRLDLAATLEMPVQFHISDFGFEMQESSNLTIPLQPHCHYLRYITLPGRAAVMAWRSKTT